MLRQQAGGLWGQILLFVMVIKWQFFMFCMVCLMVFVVCVMQMHKINDADFFLVASDVMKEVMEKLAQLYHCIYAIIGRR